MRAYLLRVAGAWILLSLAGRLMKDAEAVLRAAQAAHIIEDGDRESVIEEASSENGTGIVDEWVEAKYDG